MFHRRPKLWLSTLIALALIEGVAAQERKAEPAPASVTIRAPSDARLYVDDILLTSDARSFDTPKLQPGKEYAYTFKAEVVRDGKTVTVKKEISVRAGAEVTVDFSDLGRDTAPPVKAVAGAFKLSAQEQAVLDLTNKERAKVGAPALKANEKLFKAARAHSANMAKQEKLDHTLDGKDPGDRLADVGYTHAGWGENCAVYQRTPEEAIATWMNSEGHRGNLLNTAFTEIGIGIAKSDKGVPYYTQVFGAPRSQ